MESRISVTRIALQPSRYKPTSMKPVEMEALRLKRIIASIVFKEDSKESEVSAVVEFRGKALTLSRTKGHGDMFLLFDLLRRYYYRRYEKEELKFMSVSADESVYDIALGNPERFHHLLHLIKNHGGLQVRTSKLNLGFGGLSVDEYDFALGSK